MYSILVGGTSDAAANRRAGQTCGRVRVYSIFVGGTWDVAAWPDLQVEDAMPGCFRMDVLRQQRHQCGVTSCRSYNVWLGTEQVEAWPVTLVENEGTPEATVQELILHTFKEAWLAEGLRCGACGQQKRVLQQAMPLATPEVLVVSFPRNSHVDPHTRRQVRNEHAIEAAGSVSVTGSEYDFVALVEHIPAAHGDTEQGHFVTWVRHGAVWLRCDDAVVTQKASMPKSVARNVVLAVYEKPVLSATTERPDAATSTGRDVQVEEEEEEDIAAASIAEREALPSVQDTGAQNQALPGEGMARASPRQHGPHMETLSFGESEDGTWEFERDVAAVLGKFESGEDVAAFLATLPPYSVQASVSGGYIRYKAARG